MEIFTVNAEDFYFEFCNFEIVLGKILCKYQIST